MVAGNVRRERYREYTHFLRASATGLNIQVAPARLERLRAQVNVERNRFLFWLLSWLLIAVVGLLPILGLAAVEYNLRLPDSWDVKEFHDAVLIDPKPGPVALALFSGLLFVAAVTIAYIPIIANMDSLNDLESAHRALKDIEE